MMFFVCQEDIVKLLRNTDAWRILVQVLLSTISQLTVCHYNESRALICLEGRRIHMHGPAMPRKCSSEESLFQQIQRRSWVIHPSMSSPMVKLLILLDIIRLNYWFKPHRIRWPLVLLSNPYPTYWNSSACGYGRVKTLADVSVWNCKGACRN